MATIVIMPGGFHPFHAGHYALYQSAVQAFPGAAVYVAATDDTKTRPFPFAIKEKLAKLAGVAPGHFVQVKSPFQPKEITGHFNPEQDILIFVRSEKDRNESPKPGGMKKDGTPAYFQPYTGKNMQPFGKQSYIAYLPTVEFGPGIKSATEIRNAWPNLDDRRKTAMVMSLYPATQKNPKLAANVVKMLDMGMGSDEQGVAEGLGKDIKRLATGKDVKSRAGQEIAKSQDASMKGDTKTSKKHFARYDKLDKLANKEQGVAESDLDKFKKYTRPVVKTTPKIERTTNPAGRTNDHVEWKVTTPTGEIHRHKSKKEAQAHYDSFGNQTVSEGAGLSVEQLAHISDKALDDAYHYGRSTPGANFGWMANLQSAKAAKRLIDAGETDVEAISDAIHKGWNVTAAADYKGQLQLDTPTPEDKKLKRAKLAQQSYSQLPEEEKEKDRVVARAMLSALGKTNVSESSDYLEEK